MPVKTISSYESISKQPRIYFELSNTLNMNGALGYVLIELVEYAFVLNPTSSWGPLQEANIEIDLEASVLALTTREDNMNVWAPTHEY